MKEKETKIRGFQGSKVLQQVGSQHLSTLDHTIYHLRTALCRCRESVYNVRHTQWASIPCPRTFIRITTPQPRYAFMPLCIIYMFVYVSFACELPSAGVPSNFKGLTDGRHGTGRRRLRIHHIIPILCIVSVRHPVAPSAQLCTRRSKAARPHLLSIFSSLLFCLHCVLRAFHSFLNSSLILIRTFVSWKIKCQRSGLRKEEANITSSIPNSLGLHLTFHFSVFFSSDFDFLMLFLYLIRFFQIISNSNISSFKRTSSPTTPSSTPSLKPLWFISKFFFPSSTILHLLLHGLYPLSTSTHFMHKKCGRTSS